MNDLGLPPRRTLPPEVRDRIRGTVNTDVAPRQHRFRAPLAVAAGVAVLAAAAVMVVQSAGDPSDPVATPPSSTSVAPSDDALPPLTRDEAAKSMVDCHGALVSKGVDTAPLDQWRIAVWIRWTSDGAFALAAYAGDKPVICSQTGDHVAVTDPNTAPAYASGTRTGVLALPNGLIGGVVDPSWTQLGLILHESGGVATMMPATQADGLFLMPSLHIPGAEVEAYQIIGDNSEQPEETFPLPVGDAPAPVVLMTIPKQQEILDECFANGGPDPAGWLPGQGMGTGNGDLLMVVRGDELAVCHDDGQSGYRFTPLTTGAGPGAMVARDLPEAGLPTQPLAGRTSPSAVQAYVHFGDTTERVLIINSTFLFVPPPGAWMATVALLDGAGNVLWEGPLTR